MKKIIITVLLCALCSGCTAGKKQVHKASPKDDALIESILNQPVDDEKELEIARNIKNCTPFVQVNNGETNQYGTLSTKKLVLGFEGNTCVYKIFVNGKPDTECRFPKNILHKLSDTSTKRVHLQNWTEESMKYCKYYNRPDNIELKNKKSNS